MPARLIVHDPEGAALEFWLERDGEFVFGRGQDADLRVQDASVSRHHLRFHLRPEGCLVSDLDSKNGLIVHGERVASLEIDRHVWMQVGDLLLEVEPCSAEIVEIGRARRQQRTLRSRTLQVSRAPQDRGFLAECLDAVAALAECDHAALVLPDGEQFRVLAATGVSMQAAERPGFSGSLAALRRATAQQQSVVINDVQIDVQLAARQSVLRAGIRSVMVLPLMHDGVVQGLMYADRRKPGAPITDFDLEVAAAFVERMSLWLVAQRSLASIASWPPMGDASSMLGSAAAA